MKINFFACFCDKIKPIPNSKVGGSMKAEIIAFIITLLTINKWKPRSSWPSRFFVILFISLLSFLHPNLFLDKDAKLVEKHKEGGDEEASHKDMVEVSKDTNINQDGKKVEDD